MDFSIIDNRLTRIDYNGIRRVLSVILFVILVISLCFTMTLSAAEGDSGGDAGGDDTSQSQGYNDGDDDYETALNSLSNGGARSWAAKPAFVISAFVNGRILGFVAGSNLYTVGSSDLFTGFKSGYNLFKNIGIGLAVLWALVSVVSNMQIDHVSWDIVVKFALKMMAAVYVVNNGTVILDALVGLGDKAIEAISGGGYEGNGQTYSQIAESVRNAGFSGNMLTILTNILPFIIICIALVLMFSKLITRIIEIGIRYMFAPIAIADVFSHGGGSTGARYLKKFGAVCLSGAVYMSIVLILPVAAKLLSNGASTGVSHTGTMIDYIMPTIVYVAGIGIMNRVDAIVGDFA